MTKGDKPWRDRKLSSVFKAFNKFFNLDTCVNLYICERINAGCMRQSVKFSHDRKTLREPSEILNAKMTSRTSQFLECFVNKKSAFLFFYYFALLNWWWTFIHRNPCDLSHGLRSVMMTELWAHVDWKLCWCIRIWFVAEDVSEVIHY